MTYLGDDSRVSMIVTLAVERAGMVVTRSGATAGQVQPVDTDMEQPFGVAIENTEDPLYPEATSTQFKAAVPVAIQRKGIVECILDDGNQAIVAGDPLRAMLSGTTEKGCVDLFDELKTGTYADGTTLLVALRKLVGWALEPAAVNSGDGKTVKIKVLLDIHNG
jgi:hypothetical protein